MWRDSGHPFHKENYQIYVVEILKIITADTEEDAGDLNRLLSLYSKWQSSDITGGNKHI